jgi:hypothetical protein
MSEVKANLDQLMALIKKLDPRDAEVVAAAMGGNRTFPQAG